MTMATQRIKYETHAERRRKAAERFAKEIATHELTLRGRFRGGDPRAVVRDQRTGHLRRRVRYSGPQQPQFLLLPRKDVRRRGRILHRLHPPVPPELPRDPLGHRQVRPSQGDRRGMSWDQRAACRGRDTELWFAHESATKDIAEAKAYCHRCPVQRECLDDAIDIESRLARYGRWGIRGGLTGAERGLLVVRTRKANVRIKETV